MTSSPRLGHVLEQQAQAVVETRRRFAEPPCEQQTSSGKAAATDGRRTTSAASPAMILSEVRDVLPLTDHDSHHPSGPIVAQVDEQFVGDVKVPPTTAVAKTLKIFDPIYFQSVIDGRPSH